MSCPLFAHQLEALRRLQEMQDEEVLGRTVKRRRTQREVLLTSSTGTTRTWQTDID